MRGRGRVRETTRQTYHSSARAASELSELRVSIHREELRLLFNNNNNTSTIDLAKRPSEEMEESE